MNWTPLIDPKEAEGLRIISKTTPVILIKHSTRCGISSVILDRLSREWNDDLDGAVTFVIDVIANRAISNAVSDIFGIRHESPQLLVVWQEKVIFHTSHMGINYQAVKSAVRPLLAD